MLLLQHLSAVHPGRRLAVLVAAVVVAAGVAPARAANMDKALLEHAQDILGELKKKRYANVGVLPFQVQKPGARPSYSSAPLAVNLPGQIENTLILTLSPRNKEPMGILRDAAGVANQEKVGPWRRNARSFRALFDTRYPVAWGRRSVKPDAFLTGLVTVAEGRKKVKVAIQMFDASARKGSEVAMTPVVEFEVDTDRALLRDLGYGFVLPRSALARGVTSRQRDAWALDEKGPDDSKQQNKGRLLTPDDVAGMRFEIRYDGRKQTIRPLSESSLASDSWQVNPIKTGTKVTMVLTRVLGGEQMLGVVLKVNGRSTYEKQQDVSLRCRRWLYGPEDRDKPDPVTGFLINKKWHDFRVPTARESAELADELGARAGWIDLEVFGPGGGATLEEADLEEITVTTGALARSAERRPATLQQLREQLARANNVRLPKPKQTKEKSLFGLLVEGLEPGDAPVIIKGKLPNPVRLGGISIKYWDPAWDKRTDD